jgi:hypothetical protein
VSLARTIRRAVLGTLAFSPLRCGAPYHATDNIAVARWPDNSAVHAGRLAGTCQAFCVDYYSHLGEHSVKVATCDVDAGPDGEVVYCDATMRTDLSEHGCFDSGRLPAGAPALGESTWLERMAVLEGLSIVAFERLARDLEDHGAPRSLVAAARRARDDERRHHATMCDLLGARAPLPKLPRYQRRPLEDVLLENVVEGCVHETFGAALALWQSLTATDPKLRVAMGPIAREEIQHASLAHAVHRWGRSRVAPRSRARLSRARDTAIRSLRTRIASSNDAGNRTLGIPAAAEASRMLDELEMVASPVATFAS